MEEHIVYNKEGEEITLPGSPEEIGKTLEENKAAIEEAATTAASVKEEHDKKITELETSTKELTEKLEKAGGKVGNWKELRAKAEAGDIKLSETENLLLKKQEELEEERSNKGDDRLLGDWKDKAISKLVNEDAGLQKKVLDAYEILNIDANNEREVAEKMNSAYLIATGKAPEIDSVLGAAGAVAGGAPPQAEKAGKMSDDVKELAKRLDPSLTDEDFKTK